MKCMLFWRGHEAFLNFDNSRCTAFRTVNTVDKSRETGHRGSWRIRDYRSDSMAFRTSETYAMLACSIGTTVLCYTQRETDRFDNDTNHPNTEDTTKRFINGHFCY